MINSVRRRLTRTVSVACALGTAAFLAPIVSSARADAVNSASPINLNPCSLSPVSQPFARWLDFSHYELAPGGDFETSTWTLTGGAELVAGSDPYAATGTPGHYSLSLPAGSSAQSPQACVDAAYPTIRFFIAGQGLVAVNVVAGGLVIPAGVAIGAGEWSPSPVELTSSAVAGALSGGTAQMSVTFTTLLGHPRIDDVFIDPWGHGG